MNAATKGLPTDEARELEELAAELWDVTEVQIYTEDGGASVPAMTHPWCPGLAVVEYPFGEFNVTHIASGMKMSARFERAWGAASVLVGWAAIAKEAGFSFAEHATAVRDAVAATCDAPVPFDGGRLTVEQWRVFTRDQFAPEFPWEEASRRPEKVAGERLLALAPEAA